MAYRDIDLITFNEVLEKANNQRYLTDSEKDLYIFDELTLITVLAMKD